MSDEPKQLHVLIGVERELEAEDDAGILRNRRELLQQLHHWPIRRLVVHLRTRLAKAGHQHDAGPEDLAGADRFPQRLLARDRDRAACRRSADCRPSRWCGCSSGRLALVGEHRLAIPQIRSRRLDLDAGDARNLRRHLVDAGRRRPQHVAFAMRDLDRRRFGPLAHFRRENLCAGNPESGDGRRRPRGPEKCASIHDDSKHEVDPTPHAHGFTLLAVKWGYR